MKALRTLTVIVCAAAFCFPQFAQAQNAANSDFKQEGIASWYGPEFDGRPTASGEIFDSTQLTAAHPSLPFGTVITITNKHNNKSVTVRINDRGPFVSARIVDVSKAAAEKLDMLTTGTAPVLLEVSNGTAVPALPKTPTLAQAESPSPAVAQTAPATQPWPGNQQVSQPVYQPVPTPQQAPAAQPLYQQASAAQSETQPVYQQPVVTSGRSWPADQPMYPPAAQVSTQSYPQPTPAAQSVPAQTIPTQSASVSQPTYYQPLPIQSAQEQEQPQIATPVRQNTVVLVPAIVPSPGKVYRLQVGSYKAARNAVDSFDKLKSVGLNPAYERYEENFRVVLSGVSGADVTATTERIGAAGFKEVLIREER